MIVAAYASEALPPGAVEPALNAPNVHDAAALAAAIRSVLEHLGQRSRRVALVLPDSVAKVSLMRFEKVPAEGAGPRAADSLAGAQGGAVPDRGCAGVVAARRRASPAAAASTWSPSRAATSSQSYERACEAAGVARRPRRSRQLQSDQRRAGVRLVERATGCSSTSPPTTPRSRSSAMATSCPSATAPAASERSRRTRAPDRDVSRGPARRRRLHAASCWPARRCWAPQKPSGSGACSRSASA